MWGHGASNPQQPLLCSMLTNGVSLAVVSKTLRHAQVGITANLYGHLTPEAAHSAADSLGGVLDAAAAKLVADRATL